MAWMRMMGADSVAYHRATVLARGDDHPGQALAYYASRGETPLVWGGSGARALGLEGTVTDAQYQALYGPGGACDPTTSQRLVTTRRPGLELVISAHKSVAELGVIGRAEDMHAIMDAEHAATLAYLDLVTRTVGGRRGEASVRTATEGIVYATTRHATSRAGDPCPHDHVLVANLVRMGDARGGWKGADTALWREHLHAATMVGRVASAQRAVELGYGIVANPGPSGRLGHWAIAGVPAEVLEAHSKRASEIDEEIARTGYDSYRARNVAARATRDPKRQTPVGELLPRWVAEMEAVGWSVERLRDSVEREAATYRRPRPRLDAHDLRAITHHALSDDGPLVARKVFSKRDVIVAVAPALYGRDLSELSVALGRTLADPEAVPHYANADPVNNVDLNGDRCWSGVARRVDDKKWDEKKHRWIHSKREICRSVSRGGGRAARAAGRAVKAGAGYVNGAINCGGTLIAMGYDVGDAALAVAAGAASGIETMGGSVLVAGGIVYLDARDLRNQYRSLPDTCGLNTTLQG